MTADELRVERAEGILILTINRPASRNAMTRDVGLRIADALDELDQDTSLRAAVLTGAGGVFCAGMDLKRFSEGETTAVPGRGFGGLTERTPAKPIVAAVEGYALAGGMELALACDLIVAGEGAVFGLPEVTRGLVARAGGLIRLARSLSTARAMELALTGDRLDAPTALSWGLVNRVVPDGTTLEAALTLVRRLADNAPLAVAASKRVVLEARDWMPDEAFARQAEITDPVFRSADASEGARAFVEKRQPRWSGE